MRVLDPADPVEIALKAAEEWASTVPLAESELEFYRRFVLCPDRDREPHVWAGAIADARNPCRFCGRSGRENFAEATAARTALVGRVLAPESAHGRPKKQPVR